MAAFCGFEEFSNKDATANLADKNIAERWKTGVGNYPEK